MNKFDENWDGKVNSESDFNENSFEKYYHGMKENSSSISSIGEYVGVII